jgi:hypothetical protein
VFKATAPQTVTTHDLRRTYIAHLIVGLGLDPVCVSKIAGHSTVSVTLNVCADEFNKAVHRNHLRARIEKAGFGALQARALTSCSHEGAERPPLLRHEKNKPLSEPFLWAVLGANQCPSLPSAPDRW